MKKKKKTEKNTLLPDLWVGYGGSKKNGTGTGTGTVKSHFK